jgi:hypothetical protein
MNVYYLYTTTRQAYTRRPPMKKPFCPQTIFHRFWAPPGGGMTTPTRCGRGKTQPPEARLHRHFSAEDVETHTLKLVVAPG